MLDLIIKGGTLVDGSGGEPYTGDLGIRDGRIVEVGTLASSQLHSQLNSYQARNRAIRQTEERMQRSAQLARTAQTPACRG